MRPLLRVGLRFGIFLCAGFSLAAPTGDQGFEKRLSEIGLTYSLPPGFVDDGPNVALEKELNATLDSAVPFVVRRIRSTDGKLTIYLDPRALGIDMQNPAMAVGYAFVFEANAEEYCALVSSSPCGASTKLPANVVQADYHADLGVILKADHPNRSRIGGHKKVSVIAISKPTNGLLYTTVAYDSDGDFEKGYAAVRHMLKFR